MWAGAPVGLDQLVYCPDPGEAPPQLAAGADSKHHERTRVPSASQQQAGGQMSGSVAPGGEQARAEGRPPSHSGAWILNSPTSRGSTNAKSTL